MKSPSCCSVDESQLQIEHDSSERNRFCSPISVKKSTCRYVRFRSWLGWAVDSSYATGPCLTLELTRLIWKPEKFQIKYFSKNLMSINSSLPNTGNGLVDITVKV